jgi:hypothetical protein
MTRRLIPSRADRGGGGRRRRSVQRVDIVRHDKRFGGISMPVGVESVSSLLVAGRSTVCMSYEYESIKGRRIGTPQAQTPASFQPSSVPVSR